MPSKETEDLLAQLDELTSAASASQAASNVQFDTAIEQLDRLAGRRKTASPGEELEDLAFRTLSAIPGIVVAREPQTTESSYAPDFLVTLPNHRVLVETKAPSQPLPAVTQRIAAALDAYGADDAVVVVPNGTDTSTEPRGAVTVVSVDDLHRYFADLASA